jgi:hypothetical protein
MSFDKLRGGELLASAGAICVIVSLFVASYEGPATGTLDAWHTFGPAVVLLIAAAAGALWLLGATLFERSTAMPVTAAVWCVPLGLLGLIAALVRVLERPDHATRSCVGVWLALAGAVAILAGAWQAIRDERGSLYPPATPTPRPRP